MRLSWAGCMQARSGPRCAISRLHARGIAPPSGHCEWSRLHGFSMSCFERHRHFEPGWALQKGHSRVVHSLGQLLTPHGRGAARRVPRAAVCVPRAEHGANCTRERCPTLPNPLTSPSPHDPVPTHCPTPCGRPLRPAGAPAPCRRVVRPLAGAPARPRQ